MQINRNSIEFLHPCHGFGLIQGHVITMYVKYNQIPLFASATARKCCKVLPDIVNGRAMLYCGPKKPVRTALKTKHINPFTVADILRHCDIKYAKMMMHDAGGVLLLSYAAAPSHSQLVQACC